MNQKGQALVESLIFSTLAILCSIKLLQLGLDLRYEILFDDLIEQTLICHFQQEADCNGKLRKKLADLNFKEIQITEQSTNETAKIKLSAKTGLNSSFIRESELTLDLSVP
jgi:preprotein translocase subunit SecF